MFVLLSCAMTMEGNDQSLQIVPAEITHLGAEQLKNNNQRRGENMDKFWLQSYPPGVPAEIDITQYQSLVQLMEQASANMRRAMPMCAWTNS